MQHPCSPLHYFYRDVSSGAHLTGLGQAAVHWHQSEDKIGAMMAQLEKSEATQDTVLADLATKEGAMEAVVAKLAAAEATVEASLARNGPGRPGAVKRPQRFPW